MELWITLGATPILWISPDKVADNGPLGPISHWATLTDDNFIRHLSSLNQVSFLHLCLLKYFKVSVF